MPRIPPTSAKWYLYEISRHGHTEGRQKKVSFRILSMIGKLTFGKYFPTQPHAGEEWLLCAEGEQRP